MHVSDWLTTRLGYSWARVAKAALLQERPGTIRRMDAKPYDKTTKRERFSVENLEAGCIILAPHTAPRT
jgi:hypothetical protein